MPKLIPLSSKDFDEKLNSLQHRISVDDARKMKEKHDRLVKKPVEDDRSTPDCKWEETNSVWFSKEVFDEIFKSCDGIRIYFGTHIPVLSNGTDMGNDNNKTTTILVGTKTGEWQRDNGDRVEAPVDQLSDDDKIAIAMQPKIGETYDFGSMCPQECDGTGL